MAAGISDKARFWNHPLLPIGLLLFTLGVGNWWVSRSKVIEYSRRLAASAGIGDSDFSEYAHLDSRTNTSLLRRLHQAPATRGMAAAKRDFYELVNNGGRIIAICGFGLWTVGAIRYLGDRRDQRQASA